MPASFFFYDLETSGFDPRSARIMQFAGQRTDMSLRPIGEAVNVLIKITPDVLPDPDAVLVTGITPQATLADGITEMEFLQYFYEAIAMPQTIFLGYNSVRFDDEFIRFLNYRNLYDPYRWHWYDGSSRWDLLDVVRMTRALRPDGIVWPFASDGSPSNRLELLTSVNKLEHWNAHDALGDVRATIAVTQLIKDKQPKLFDYLLDMRDKKKVMELTDAGQPFVYSSGKYSSQFEKTTVVSTVALHPNKQGVLVYDLRYDPTEFLRMTASELADRWKWAPEPRTQRLPVKTLQFNRCPAVAPLGVLDDTAAMRIHIDQATIRKNLITLKAATDWPQRLMQALEILNKQQQTSILAHEQNVDGQLYDGFFDDHDSRLLSVIRKVNPEEIMSFTAEVHDPRLKALLPLYKARNYPDNLTDEERQAWDSFCRERLLGGKGSSRLATFMRRLEELNKRAKNAEQTFLIEELRLYVESLIPTEMP